MSFKVANLSGFGSGAGGPLELTISTPQVDLNLNTWLQTQGWPGSTDEDFIVTVAPGVSITGSTPATDALDTGPFPALSTLSLIVEGSILGDNGNGGKGGNGGPGKDAGANGQNGGTAEGGGNAINLQIDMAISGSGTVSRGGGGSPGGGGGGGGGGAGVPTSIDYGGGGGGWGNGAAAGTGGNAGSSGSNGNPGLGLTTPDIAPEDAGDPSALVPPGATGGANGGTSPWGPAGNGGPGGGGAGADGQDGSSELGGVDGGTGGAAGPSGTPGLSVSLNGNTLTPPAPPIVAAPIA